MQDCFKYFLKLHPVIQGSLLLCLTILVIAALSNPVLITNLEGLFKALPVIVYMPLQSRGVPEKTA